MAKYQKIAFIFPGQGAQYPGMGKDFIENFSAARLTFEEADDLLERKLSKIILNGPDSTLTQTQNSQLAIYTTSIAILRVIQEMTELQPAVCAGLSLGEYTALTAADVLPFIHCLPLIRHRAQFMSEACVKHPGTMAVVVGLNAEEVAAIVQEANMPKDLWIANYNCPGQVVLSGTIKGIEAGTNVAKLRGAKKVLPLNVQGAFHSGLMKSAEGQLEEYVHKAPLKPETAKLVMNVPGDFVSDISAIRKNLIQQVTHSVRWEQGIRAMDASDVDLFIEVGPGTTLTGMNKRINPRAKTLNVETVEDFDKLVEALKG